jgi:hypothetical protein
MLAVLTEHGTQTETKETEGQRIMKRKELTPEQIAAKAAKKERFSQLCKLINAMGADEKMAVVARAGAVCNVDGRALSPRNTILCFYQREGVTIVGGFRQWLAKGRCVRKGEHGMSILVPIGTGRDVEHPEGRDEPVAFVGGTVFDVSQTAELPQVEGDGGAVTAAEVASVPELAIA